MNVKYLCHKIFYNFPRSYLELSSFHLYISALPHISRINKSSKVIYTLLNHLTTYIKQSWVENKELSRVRRLQPHLFKSKVAVALTFLSPLVLLIPCFPFPFFVHFVGKTTDIDRRHGDPEYGGLTSREGRFESWARAQGRPRKRGEEGSCGALYVWKTRWRPGEGGEGVKEQCVCGWQQLKKLSACCCAHSFSCFLIQ